MLSTHRSYGTIGLLAAHASKLRIAWAYSPDSSCNRQQYMAAARVGAIRQVRSPSTCSKKYRESPCVAQRASSGLSATSMARDGLVAPCASAGRGSRCGV